MLFRENIVREMLYLAHSRKYYSRNALSRAFAKISRYTVVEELHIGYSGRDESVSDGTLV